MIRYNLESIERNLSEIFSGYSEWDYFAKQTSQIKHYAKGMDNKNEIIQKLFEGTDGRIVIGQEDLSMSSDWIALLEIQKYMSEDLSHDIRKLMEESSFDSYSIRDEVRESFSKFSKSITIDNKKVKGGGAMASHPYNGWKLTKALTTIFDSVLSWTSFTSGASAEQIKAFSTNVKNKIIGGKIAGFSGNMNLDGKKLVLSIRPEDLFLISHGNSWRSCMAPDQGEYNTGLLGYITGPDTLVGFTLNEDDVDDFTAPRQWRQIMYLTDSGDTETLISQRGYPQENELYSSTLNDIVINSLGWEERHNVTKNIRDVSLTQGSGDYGYVDILRYGLEAMTQAISKSPETKEIKFTPQGELHCLECGSDTWDASECGGTCSSCVDHRYCGRCDDRMGRGDEQVQVYHSPDSPTSVCESCSESSSYVFSDFEDKIIYKNAAEFIPSIEDYVFSSSAIKGYLGDYILKKGAIYSNIYGGYISEELLFSVELNGNKCRVLEEDVNELQVWFGDVVGIGDPVLSNLYFKDYMGREHNLADEINVRLKGDKLELLADSICLGHLSSEDETDKWIAKFLLKSLGIDFESNESGNILISGTDSKGFAELKELFS